MHSDQKKAGQKLCFFGGKRSDIARALRVFYKLRPKEKGDFDPFFFCFGKNISCGLRVPIQQKLTGHPKKAKKQILGEKEKACHKKKQRPALFCKRQAFDAFKRPQVRFLFVASHKIHQCTPTKSAR